MISLCGKTPQNNESGVYENLALFWAKMKAAFGKSVSVSRFVHILHFSLNFSHCEKWKNKVKNLQFRNFILTLSWLSQFFKVRPLIFNTHRNEVDLEWPHEIFRSENHWFLRLPLHLKSKRIYIRIIVSIVWSKYLTNLLMI